MTAGQRSEGRPNDTRRQRYANCYVCLVGTRTWTLGHPDHDLERAPGAVSARSDVDPRIAFVDVALEPGDALLVPANWWHRVAAADDPARGFSAAISWYVDAE